MRTKKTFREWWSDYEIRDIDDAVHNRALHRVTDKKLRDHINAVVDNRDDPTKPGHQWKVQEVMGELGQRSTGRLAVSLRKAAIVSAAAAVASMIVAAFALLRDPDPVVIQIPAPIVIQTPAPRALPPN
jgi:hypothetical protein